VAKKDLDKLNNDILSIGSFTLSNKRIKLSEGKKQEVDQELTTKVYDVEIDGITNYTTKQSISFTDKQDLEFMISISSMDSNSLALIFVTFIQAIKPSILSSNMIHTTFKNS
ncbi:9535_t:CDS:2, partial [Funneliformis caledonium]